jgi:RND family efflux transporter MFP subunit
MPMEPVYADDETPVAGNSSRFMPPGTVKITPEKQQMIGVRVDKVEMTSQGHAVRTLGRVSADENRTYRVITNTEGWVQDVQGCTTGSLVQKDQVMALISTYSVDFYTWQWQYLTYTAYQRPPGTQLPKSRLPMVQQPETMQPEAQQAEVQQHEPHQEGSQPAEMQQSETHPQGLEHPEEMQPEAQQPAAPLPRARYPRAQQAGAMAGEARQEQAPQAEAQGSSPRQSSPRQFSSAYSLTDSNIYKAKLELLNVGLKEEQLEELARTGQYQTRIEIRSPVTGFVLSRTVSPLQRSEKGAELYRIADLSQVWVLANVFERDAPFVHPGTTARVTIPRQEGTFEAKVTEVLPQFDTTTRTLKVRLELDNPDFALIPDMFVDVEFLISLPQAITVPVDALLDSGLRQTVFIDLGNGFFEPREVQTGWRLGDRVEIVGGLMPGERIVVSGNFLIDSESRMKLAAGGFYGTPANDPSCGMEVYPSKAIPAALTVESEGKTYFFCSPECKEQFEKDLKQSPAKPAAKEAQQPTLAAHDGQSDNEMATRGFFVKDPVCGMPLSVSKAKAAGLEIKYGDKTYYFCSDECRSQFMKSAEPHAEKPAQEGAHPAVPNGGEHMHD